MDASQSILNILDRSLCDNETFDAYKKRHREGSLTRDENPATHYCVYFLPFDRSNNKVFIVHHKKSGLWISPGGHIDKGETLLEALNREIEEELGVKGFFKEEQSPFLLTITPIENRVQPCKTHFDVWYLVPTDGSNFNINPLEFNDTKWMAIEEAEKVVTDPANRQALETLKSNVKGLCQ